MRASLSVTKTVSSATSGALSGCSHSAGITARASLIFAWISSAAVLTALYLVTADSIALLTLSMFA